MASDRKQHKDHSSNEHVLSEHQLLAASAPANQTNHHKHDARTLRALQALTDTALSHLSLEALLPELLERVRSVMQVDNAAILLLDDDAQELELRAASGLEEEVIGRVRIPVGAGFAGRIAAERTPLAVENLSSYAVSSPFLREKLRSVLGVPLLAGDRVLGVVHIGSATPRRFTSAETALLEQVADRIARAVERAQLYAGAEAARQLAEQRTAFLSTTLEALGDGLIISDAEGHILFGNSAYASLLGATPTAEGTNADGTELASHIPSRLHLLNVRDAQGNPVPADQLAIARALRGETLAGPTALELQIRRLDGQDAFLSITATPVRGGAGELLGAVLVVRDVTERRRLEQQAHDATRRANERAARLEAIFATVADGLFVYDADGRVVERNPAAAAMLSAFVPPETHDASIYERDRHIAGGVRDAAGLLLADEEWPPTRIARGEVLVGPSSVDIRIRRQDGRETYVNVSGAPLRDEDSSIVGSVCLYRDVTERWELNELLQGRAHDVEAANARLRTLLDVLPVGVAITDVERKQFEVNPAFLRIWGDGAPLPQSPGDYSIYRGWWTATGKPVRPDEWAMERTLATGELILGDEIEIETFTGERKVVLNTAAPLLDASGTIIGGVAAMLDITEQKHRTERTRQALEAFIAITRTLVDMPADRTAPDGRGNGGTSSSGASGDRTSGNGASDDGASGDGTIARRLAELTRDILGCSRVSISAVEGERLLTRPVAVVGLTPEQERQWWTEQMALAGQPMGAGAVPEDRQRLLAGEMVTFDLTRPPYDIPNPYGVTSLLAAAMRTQGRIVGMLGLDFQDKRHGPHRFTPEEMQITEAVARLGAVVLEHDRLLREREAARAEALALTDANQRMDEFLGIAGHELRTPLTIVKANLQLAERRARQAFNAAQQHGTGERRHTSEADTGAEHGPLEQLLRLLDRATVSVERQERLVQDLLDISRISAGRIEYRMDRYDLTPLVRETVEEQRVSVPSRHITLDVPAEPVVVVADGDRIGQVMTNYLTNALKYSAEDRPVAVVLRRDDTLVRVAVTDGGPGLTPAQRRHLFERFHRVKGIDVMSGSGVGLGLGLYISKTIVEQHGGRVGVESEPGHGSTFWFELPLPEDS